MNLQNRLQDIVNEIQYTLGPGHDKTVYLTSLIVALQDENILFETDKVIPISFRNRFVGTMTADIIVDQRMVVMLGVNRNELMDQCRMYRRFSQHPFGIVVVFTPQGPILEPC